MYICQMRNSTQGLVHSPPFTVGAVSVRRRTVSPVVFIHFLVQVTKPRRRTSQRLHPAHAGIVDQGIGDSQRVPVEKNEYPTVRTQSAPKASASKGANSGEALRAVTNTWADCNVCSFCTRRESAQSHQRCLKDQWAAIQQTGPTTRYASAGTAPTRYTATRSHWCHVWCTLPHHPVPQ